MINLFSSKGRRRRLAITTDWVFGQNLAHVSSYIEMERCRNIMSLSTLRSWQVLHNSFGFSVNFIYFGQICSCGRRGEKWAYNPRTLQNCLWRWYLSSCQHLWQAAGGFRCVCSIRPSDGTHCVYCALARDVLVQPQKTFLCAVCTCHLLVFLGWESGFIIISPSILVHSQLQGALPNDF